MFCTQTHRAVKDHTVAIAHTFNVGGEVETDGSVANGIHGLGIKEVVGPRWRMTKADESRDKQTTAEFPFHP